MVSGNFRKNYISIHALREEGDWIFHSASTCSSVFLSTPSARRATAQVTAQLSGFNDFYPRPPRGGRPLIGQRFNIDDLFLSTPSARRAT